MIKALFFIFFIPTTAFAILNVSEFEEAFRSKDYQNVLARAQIYRSNQKNNLYKYDNVLSLEVLTLARLCRWSIIKLLINSEVKKDYWPKLMMTKKTLDQINLKHLYSSYKNDQMKVKKSKMQIFKSKRDYWKLNIKQAQKFSNFKNLTLNLESKCKK